MKKDDLYLYEKISDIPYLLPIGQKTADHMNVIKLNESSGYIIRLLQEYDDIEKVKQCFFEKYGVTDDEKESVTEEILFVLSRLNMMGALKNMDDTMNVPACGDTFFFRIGKIVVSITGNESLIADNLKAFACEEEEAYQKIALINGAPSEHLNGVIVVRTEEVIITRCEDRYIMLFPAYNNIYELHISKDGRNANLYYKDSYNESYKERYNDDSQNEKSCECEQDSLKDLLFNVLRFAYLVAAKENGMYVIHSASVLYNGRAWLFSGRSGEGKTTQTQLWKKYLDTPVLNGDLNMLGFEDGKPVVYGLPWCGTSGIYTASEYPLGGIIFIKKSEKSYVEEPEPDEKRILLLQRLISPMWEEKMLEEAVLFSDKMADNTNTFRLYCEKNEKTVRIMCKIIDKIYC